MMFLFFVFQKAMSSLNNDKNFKVVVVIFVTFSLLRWNKTGTGCFEFSVSSAGSDNQESEESEIDDEAKDEDSKRQDSEGGAPKEART